MGFRTTGVSAESGSKDRVLSDRGGIIMLVTVGLARDRTTAYGAPCVRL